MESTKTKDYASLRLDNGLKVKLLAVAKTERRTLSQVIRLAIEHYLASRKGA